MAEPNARERAEAEVEFARVVAFSDGVFAIAMTLLVLGLSVPAGLDDLGDALLDERASLFSYALSFAVLAKLWLDHHQFFGGLERFDRRLMTLNLVYLAFVAVIPFTSQVLGDYGDRSAAVILYAASIAAVALVLAVQVSHAYRRGLLREDYRAEARASAPGAFAAVIVFCASIPLALIDPVVAMVSWIAASPVGDRLGEPLAKRLLGS